MTSPYRPFVIVPTYNESANIERLLSELFGLEIPDLCVLVIDDDSPDGTSNLVIELCKKHPGLRLVTRKGIRGRGSAGLVGIALAMSWDASAIVEMDADFSHPPSLVPTLLNTLERADVSIASRLAPGAHDTRPLSRRAITRAANAYARLFLQRFDHLSRVRDWTSGYRAYRRRVFEDVRPESLRSTGPSVLQEVLFNAVEAGCTVEEIPFTMKDREAGLSTFSRKVATQSLKMIPRYRFGRQRADSWSMADYNLMPAAGKDGPVFELTPVTSNSAPQAHE